MFEKFLEQFNKKVPLTAAESTQLQEHLTVKKVRKKQYLLQEGEVCKNLAFVEKGLLRAYSIDDTGREHIIQFALEGWVISDLYSFLTGEPATYNIEAIEDTEVVLISQSAHATLLLQIPKYETFTRLNITGAYLAMQKRLTSTISATLEDRYEAFIALYPHIAERVPQHMIAAYLGLTPETLSRVRKRISLHK
ncbi:Crp/Fnr family transcriptional regulator [Paraflavitalea pollutisoli]|uniref:Crp/Fnr family transcriptional regulator n=1 Tax=Paraflavitalea pollutisoli TaxID=3034143 RepID=UPI0023ED6E7E|nr:Crp/Fnr family transcriptional regulator [Paraflavitalea sp. H1-2-19X]